MRLLQALLVAYEALQKDTTVGVRALAAETGISEAWAETIYRDAPPPKITEWANIWYSYSLVEGSVFQRRLGYLAALLLEQGIIPKPVNLCGALDASVIVDALKAARESR